MIDETIAKIEDHLRNADLPPEKRLELQQLLAELRAEAAACQVAPPASTRSDEDVRSAVNRLESSLTEFEASHPQLVGIVNRISTILANMGI